MKAFNAMYYKVLKTGPEFSEFTHTSIIISLFLKLTLGNFTKKIENTNYLGFISQIHFCLFVLMNRNFDEVNLFCFTEDWCFLHLV